MVLLLVILLIYHCHCVVKNRLKKAEMSRIVVKNLPKKITVQKLKKIFSEKGDVTDVQPKYTKTGTFRQFAFIGFKTEGQAQATKDHFHNTFIQTSKIKVEISRPLGDSSVKSWSKHTKKMKEDPKSKSPKQVVRHKKKHPEQKNDADFSDFVGANTSGSAKASWSGHAVTEVEMHQGADDSSDSEMDESSENDISSAQKKVEAEKPCVEFTVKVKKLPFSCKRKHLITFFQPLKPISIRIPPKEKGFAYVSFSNEKDRKKALNKHKGILEGKVVHVTPYEKKEAEHESKENVEKNVPEGDPAELIAETGRIYVRNLCYSVTEQELKEHFSKFGPTAEVYLPVDFYTKQPVGYAFISYVFAEHAIKAYTELDGTDFQGRMLHVLPGRPKIEYVIDTEAKTFKEKKAAKQKSLAHSPHNWNALFLGPNAVADVMSKEYNVSKADILSSETKESAAVRMALGETQLVVETRKFLMQHGIKLDAFGQAAAERSKTVIISKNLPAETTPEELSAVFSKYGTVNRVIRPPSGISALVEFQDPTEAKTAFNKLAYSRIRYKPLYLEWAPLDVFSAEPLEGNVDVSEEDDILKEVTDDNACEEIETSKKESDDDEEEEEEHAGDEPPEGTALYVKNLNFDTTEKDLEKHFKVCGPLHSVTISKKKDLKSGTFLSMGFGFVQYKKKSSAEAAIQDLQLSELDGHALELKYSHRAAIHTPDVSRKKSKMLKASNKICVRNIPFEATKKEIQDIFEQFGELKYVRLPQQTGKNQHRGFCFVEFVSKRCAKYAFKALCHSTHLLGRRLVLEWALPDTEDVDALRKRTARDAHQSEPEKRVKKTKLMEDALLAKPAGY